MPDQVNMLLSILDKLMSAVLRAVDWSEAGVKAGLQVRLLPGIKGSYTSLQVLASVQQMHDASICLQLRV